MDQKKQVKFVKTGNLKNKSNSGAAENMQGIPSPSNPAASDNTGDVLCIPSTCTHIPSSSD
ncbi:hypothetical protein DPMN_064385 [Dreissena polymorpha]|uniref:Uncharacterized protein n=1 Tax=Dreissena polymorpha TaxID=45954 RepID=A0A9D4HL37_DREPO|nr:hypothetical protein DPMN_064385 [Dreissena polymorpha]